MRVTKSKGLTILACSLVVATLFFSHPGTASPSLTTNTSPAGLVSWNPNVQCTPTLVTVEQILGNQPIPLGGATQRDSMFNTGTTSPFVPDNPKTWFTP